MNDDLAFHQTTSSLFSPTSSSSLPLENGTRPCRLPRSASYSVSADNFPGGSSYRDLSDLRIISVYSAHLLHEIDNHDFTWLPSSNGAVPSSAVPAGVDGRKRTVYIARVITSSEWESHGNLQQQKPSHKIAQLHPIYKAAITTTGLGDILLHAAVDYEVLCTTAEHLNTQSAGSWSAPPQAGNNNHPSLIHVDSDSDLSSNSLLSDYDMSIEDTERLRVLLCPGLERTAQVEQSRNAIVSWVQIQLGSTVHTAVTTGCSTDMKVKYQIVRSSSQSPFVGILAFGATTFAWVIEDDSVEFRSAMASPTYEVISVDEAGWEEGRVMWRKKKRRREYNWDMIPVGGRMRNGEETYIARIERNNVFLPATFIPSLGIAICTTGDEHGSVISRERFDVLCMHVGNGRYEEEEEEEEGEEGEEEEENRILNRLSSDYVQTSTSAGINHSDSQCMLVRDRAKKYGSVESPSVNNEERLFQEGGLRWTWSHDGMIPRNAVVAYEEDGVEEGSPIVSSVYIVRIYISTANGRVSVLGELRRWEMARGWYEGSLHFSSVYEVLTSQLTNIYSSERKSLCWIPLQSERERLQYRVLRGRRRRRGEGRGTGNWEWKVGIEGVRGEEDWDFQRLCLNSSGHNKGAEVIINVEQPESTNGIDRRNSILETLYDDRLNLNKKKEKVVSVLTVGTLCILVVIYLLSLFG